MVAVASSSQVLREGGRASRQVPVALSPMILIVSLDENWWHGIASIATLFVEGQTAPCLRKMWLDLCYGGGWRFSSPFFEVGVALVLALKERVKSASSRARTGDH